jgi:hypothetical protein
MADNPITRKEKYLAKLTGSYTGNVPDPITRVEKYLYDLCRKGISGLTPEEIENAVNKYLKENPVQPGATEEQAQQIKQNTDDVASLKEDLSNKITKLYASNQGETHITDSDNGKIQDMMIYGKSSQDGTPTPENPVEIKSVVNPTVKVCGKNLLKATLQTATVNGVTCTNNGDGTYTLNGTASGGNPSFRIGKIIAKSGRKLVGSPGAAGSYVSYLPNGTWNNVTEEKGDGSIISNIGKGTDEIAIVVLNGTTVNNLLFKPMITTDLTATYDDFEPYHEQTVTIPYTLNAIPVESGGNVTIDGQQYVSDYVDVERGKLVRMVDSSKLDNTQSIIGKIEWLLAGPQEIDLTQEEVQALKALVTYCPTTNISINSEQLDGYAVFNYPISMANIITSLKTKTENLESANYTDRGTLADTDAFLINDGTGMKRSVLSKLSDFVLGKIADKVFEKLQTNDKTILGAINELNIIIGANNAAAHNAIYRGKNLGTQFTAEMSANIKNGTFKDMYCGDYLVINGTTYRFMDFDYLYKTGDTSLDTHSILVVPDAPMYNHVMNDTNTTEGGYVGSKMYTSGLDQALAKIKADFGEAHIVTYRNLLVNTVSNGVPSNWAWYSRQIDLMNEEMVYGTRAWSQTSQNGNDTGTNKSQLAAFKHNHSLISSCRSWYWLRAVHSSTHFCYVGSDGAAAYHDVSDSSGVRPCFLIS